ncbi:MAG: stage II sporulation protein M, partial [Flavobacteriales bacterium]|nr:stage II sporulation protein M [Flavobacteriales bacterium]
IIIGIVPIFIVAGFLEGFVTRHTDMPIYLSLFIILGSFSFVIWYFIIYPRTIKNF